jgi:aspartyl-tRNA synthetase
MTKRTHPCGEVAEQAIGQQVALKGWVQKRRDLGGLIFVDLRDRTGIVQIVFNPAISAEALAIADSLRNEYVVEITGEVVARQESQVNPIMKTGRIEVQASQVLIINEAKNPPFAIENQTEVSEDLRLKYRYLDLRRPVMYDILKMRSEVTKSIRRFLDEETFIH